MQTTRPRIMEGFTNRVAIFLKKYSIKCERFRLWIVLFWTKTSQRLTLYLLSITDNIHIVLENDNTVLIKDFEEL